MNRWKGALVATVFVLAAFAVGFAWQYARAESLEDEVERLERDLAFQELATRLGAATIEAQQNSYEAARRAASEFFTGLQANIDRAPEAMAGDLDAILARRDEVITDLSRAVPAASDTLAALFVRYRLTWEVAHEEEHDTTAAEPAGAA